MLLFETMRGVNMQFHSSTETVCLCVMLYILRTFIHLLVIYLAVSLNAIGEGS